MKAQQQIVWGSNLINLPQSVWVLEICWIWIVIMEKSKNDDGEKELEIKIRRVWKLNFKALLTSLSNWISLDN